MPVFQKPFTLLMDVVPEATPRRKAFAGRNELVISGTLEYQACDDKLLQPGIAAALVDGGAAGLVPGAPQPTPAK